MNIKKYTNIFLYLNILFEIVVKIVIAIEKFNTFVISVIVKINKFKFILRIADSKGLKT